MESLFLIVAAQIVPWRVIGYRGHGTSMVDHSRGVVRWVRPTMQLNRHRFEAQHGSKTKLRSCFVRVSFEAGTILKMTVAMIGEDGTTGPS